MLIKTTQGKLFNASFFEFFEVRGCPELWRRVFPHGAGTVEVTRSDFSPTATGGAFWALVAWRGKEAHPLAYGEDEEMAELLDRLFAAFAQNERVFDCTGN